MTIDTKRLETDAAYWDEVARPSATHYSHRDGFICTTTPKACDIPRPTKPASPEWDGVSAKHIGMKFQSSLGLCELMAIDSNNVTCCVRFVDSGHLQFCSLDALEPIRTKAQRDRDELIGLMRSHYSGSMSPVADAILSRYNLEPKP